MRLPISWLLLLLLLLLFLFDRGDRVVSPAASGRAYTAATVTDDDELVLVVDVTVTSLLSSALLPLAPGDTRAASRGGAREAEPSRGS